jgi:hypothetical protein
VKFIERQKLTRLEKTVNRQLSAIKEQSTPDTLEVLQLQEQLKVIALDQLYVAFYPSDVKYMSLFTNGMIRAVDDERGQKRRKEIWKRIREGLLGDSKDSETMLADAKSWVNLDAAKKALLEIDENTYPNAPELLKKIPGNSDHLMTKIKASKQSKNGKESKPASDNRFVLSKEIDGMFTESTSGLDYEEKLAMDQDGSDRSSTSSGDSSDDDAADPLKEFGAKTAKTKDKDSSSSSSSSSDDEAEKTKPGKAAKGDSSSSSSGSDSSDSDSEAGPKKSNSIMQSNQYDKDNEQSDVESEDDFFASEKISAAEVFKQAENQQHKKNSTDDHHYYQSRKGDKSKGFASQNQTKREFRNFQHRKKRSKLG